MNTATPKISVIISIYNGASDIDRCFESIASQTEKDFEVIVVDDHSTDETLQKLQKWRAQERMLIRIVCNSKNIGLTKSLNKALTLSKAQYIARIDADDVWHPEKLAHQIIFLEENPDIGIVGSNYTARYERTAKYRSLPESHEEIQKKILRRNPFAHSCILAQRALIEKVGYYDEMLTYGQDYELWLRLFPHTKFHNLQEDLCTRYITKTSTRKQRAQMWQSIKTRMRYREMYAYPLWQMIYLFEPLALIILPGWLKNLKRRYL